MCLIFVPDCKSWNDRILDSQLLASVKEQENAKKNVYSLSIIKWPTLIPD